MTAKDFAIRYHGDQQYNGQPYSVHLEEVVKIVTLEAGLGSYAEKLAWLHDVVEDTEATIDDVDALFGDLIARGVALLTDESGINRKERKEKTNAKHAGIGVADYVVLAVKVADRLANVRTCHKTKNKGLLKMYQKEHSEFKKAVYRKGVCDDLWMKLNMLIEKEL